MADDAISEEDMHTAVLVFAHFIGIDIEHEQHLLHIAYDALSKKGLPAGWELGIGDDANKGIPYFFNTETAQSVWNHPREAVFMRKVKEEKEKDKQRKAKKDAQDSKAGKPTPKKPEKKVAKEASAPVAKQDELIMEEFDDPDAVQTIEPEGDEKPVKPIKKSNSGGFGMSMDDFMSSDMATPPKPSKPSKPTGGAGTKADREQDRKQGKTASRAIEGPPVPSRPAKGAAEESKPRPNTSAGITGNRDRERDRDRDRDRDSRGAGEGRDRDRPASSGADRREGPRRPDERDRERDRDRVAPRDKGGGERDRDRDREREREQREQRERDRERESDLRARDREREREARERDRQRERERESSLAKDLDTRLTEERRRTDEERRRASHFEDEAETLRDKVRDSEDSLAEERERRRRAEERFASAQTDYDTRLRSTVDSWEEKLRRSRDDVEADLREKQRLAATRAQDDLDEARSEAKEAKAKLNDALKDVDMLRRKVTSSKEDGKLESLDEVMSLKADLATAEDVNRTHHTEIRRLREENVELGSKLTAALQANQVALAEAEMAKAQASNVVAEGQSSHTALVQATNRIQDMDTEMARLKGELLLHKKDAEAGQAELRKLQGREGSHAERVTSAEVEVRKAKINAQSEVMRLQARIQELESANEVLSHQVDEHSRDQAAAVRTVERQLDKVSFDKVRVEEKLRAEEAKSEAGTQRIIECEKLLSKRQDVIFKKDRELREEKLRTEQAEARTGQVRDQLETDIKALHSEILTHRSKAQEDAIAHQREIAAIQKDVAERLPKLSAQAVEKVEKQFQDKLESEVATVKQRYELSAERSKRELLELQTSFAEREARARVATADERADLERLKGQNSRLVRQVEELEAQLDEVHSAMKAKSRALLQADKERYLQAIDHDRSAMSLPGVPPPPAASLNHSIEREESGAQDFAVQELQQQLAAMKSQLGAALERTVNTSARADYVPFSVTKSAYNSTRPFQRVTFSPESLFMSPEAKPATSMPTAGTERPDKSAVRFAGDPNHEGGVGASEEEEFDYMPSPGPNNASAVDRSYAAYDVDMLASAKTWKAESEAKGFEVSGMEVASQSAYDTEPDDVGVEDPQFGGIQDGGFHEGYWKARYANAMNKK